MTKLSDITKIQNAFKGLVNDPVVGAIAQRQIDSTMSNTVIIDNLISTAESAAGGVPAREDAIRAMGEILRNFSLDALEA